MFVDILLSFPAFLPFFFFQFSACDGRKHQLTISFSSVFLTLPSFLHCFRPSSPARDQAVHIGMILRVSPITAKLFTTTSAFKTENYVGIRLSGCTIDTSQTDRMVLEITDLQARFVSSSPLVSCILVCPIIHPIHAIMIIFFL